MRARVLAFALAVGLGGSAWADDGARRVTPWPAGAWFEHAVKVANPVLRWERRGPASTVKVTALDSSPPEIIWQTIVRGDRVTYGGPPLQPGMPYAVEVSGNAGDVQTAIFSIDPRLDRDDRTVVLKRNEGEP